MADAASSHTPTITKGRGPDGGNFAIIAWTAMGGTGTGAWIECPGTPQTVYVNGTFGSGTAVLQGSNEPVTTTTPDGVGLTHEGTTAISATSEYLKRVWEDVVLLRAVVTGGTGRAINVYVKVRLN